MSGYCMQLGRATCCNEQDNKRRLGLQSMAKQSRGGCSFFWYHLWRSLLAPYLHLPAGSSRHRQRATARFAAGDVQSNPACSLTVTRRLWPASSSMIAEQFWGAHRVCTEQQGAGNKEATLFARASTAADKGTSWSCWGLLTSLVASVMVSMSVHVREKRRKPS
jgi:hypothetical protein